MGILLCVCFRWTHGKSYKGIMHSMPSWFCFFLSCSWVCFWRAKYASFTSSFSVAWQLPSLVWITHKTRVERTVSFLCTSLSVLHGRRELKVSSVASVTSWHVTGCSLPRGKRDISLLAFNPNVTLDSFFCSDPTKWHFYCAVEFLLK